MLRWLLSLALLIVVCSFTSTTHTGIPSQDSRLPSHPGFHPSPEVPAMPKALMKFPRTNITSAKLPALDFHFHGARLRTAEDYKNLIKLMDDTGIGVICNMDGGFGKTFDQNMRVGEPYRDRIIHFARLDFERINEPGWSARTAAELELLSGWRGRAED